METIGKTSLVIIDDYAYCYTETGGQIENLVYRGQEYTKLAQKVNGDKVHTIFRKN